MLLLWLASAGHLCLPNAVISLSYRANLHTQAIECFVVAAGIADNLPASGYIVCVGRDSTGWADFAAGGAIATASVMALPAEAHVIPREDCGEPNPRAELRLLNAGEFVNYELCVDRGDGLYYSYRPLQCRLSSLCRVWAAGERADLWVTRTQG